MGPSFRSGRRRGLVAGAMIGSARAKKGAAAQAQAAPAAPAQPAPAADTGQDQINQLRQLGELRDQGVLTEEEFAAKKKQILGL